MALASGGLKGRGRRRAALGARTAPSAAAVCPAFARDMAGERFEGGERALQRAALDAFRPPVGEKGAQIAWRAVGEIGDRRRRAEALLEKGEKLPGVAAVSLDRARRQAPLVGEMAKPGGRRRGEVGRGGEGGEFGEVGGLRHRKDDARGRVKRRLRGCERHWRRARSDLI